jgi:hypothetical protein
VSEIRRSSQVHGPTARPRFARTVALAALLLFGVSLLVACGASAAGQANPDDPVRYTWQSVDVGSVGLVGDVDAAADGSSLVVRASGSDVWDAADGFRFTFQPLRGDGSLTVRVDGIEAANEWTKVGVMVREDVAPGARNAFVLLTESNGALFQRREVAGGSTSDVLPDGTYMRSFDASAPWWLRIERQGSTLIGSHSRDGSAWSELGRVAIDLPEDVLIGTAVTSRTNEAVATGAFSNVIVHRADGGDDASLPPVPITGPTVSASYVRSSAAFPNPERGWYTGGNPAGYQAAAANGYTLVMRYVRLDDYRNAALPAAFLSQLDQDLAGARQHGLKIVLRFTYNFGFTADAPRDRVLQHIGQLAPILQANADVIAVLQAGFIGAWGEWHSSTNGLLSFENRSAVANALLGALPSSRMIQIRTPYHARDLFALPTATTAFGTSASARVGQVNDCFLTNGSDAGTFQSDADRAYAAAVSAYTVQGGETCDVGGLNSENDAGNALAALEQYHYDYLNHDFWRPIVDKWRSQGAYDEITRRLGYRYVLQEATAQSSVVAGGTFSLNVRVANEGFGKLYNPRPLNVVLRPVGGGAPTTLRAAEDARRVLPLSGATTTVPLTVRLPAGLPSGAYDVFVSLPDAASALAGDPRYAVRFANENVWNASTGLNALNLRVVVE